MSEQVKMNVYYSKEIDEYADFLVKDTSSILIHIFPDKNVKILEVYDFKTLENIVPVLNEDFVLLFKVNLTKDEFPESEYYEPYITDPSDIGDKKPLPYDEVFERERVKLEPLGLVNINNFINYEFSQPYIYPNSIGKKVIEFINEFLSR